MPRKPRPLSFSLCDTDAIVKAIAKRAPKGGYTMNLPLSTHDAKVVQLAVNQGIDSRLEACYVPSRGDRYEITRREGILGDVRGGELDCMVSAESLPVLVRRLLEMDDGTEDGPGDWACSLASSIAGTLDIEVV